MVKSNRTTRYSGRVNVVPLDQAAAAELLRGLNRRLLEFPGEFSLALVGVLNTMAYDARDEAFRLLEERYYLKPEMKSRGLKVTRAGMNKGGRLYASVKASFRPMTLGWWRAGTAELGGQDQGKYYRLPGVKILRSTGAKVVQGAFWLRGKNGQPLIFKRVRKGLFGLFGSKLKALYGPHPFAYLRKSEALGPLEDKTMTRFEALLNERAEKKLQKLGAL